MLVIPLLVFAVEGLPAATGAVAATTGMILQQVDYSALPGWAEDRISEALSALRASCGVLQAQPPESSVGPGGVGGTAAAWQAVCSDLPSPGTADGIVRRYIEASFKPFAVVGADGPHGLFTGYFEPELPGSRHAGAAFAVPLYRIPQDLATVAGGADRNDLQGQNKVGRVVDGRLKPYHTRAEIDAGALAGRGLELLWLADPIEAYFLQIQGSGRIRLAEGGSVRVGYAASNGHADTAIARILVERGELSKEAASMQALRRWLRDHPSEATELMQRNARYIFFKEIEGSGPRGALGVTLTPGRSLAIDAGLLPLGAPLWLDSTYPAGTPEAGQPLRRLVVAQDTGAAIKGTVRGDLYWGSGEEALLYAGPMRQQGSYFLLLPRTAP